MHPRGRYFHVALFLFERKKIVTAAMTVFIAEPGKSSVNEQRDRESGCQIRNIQEER
jgi:hypothetical protein